MPFVVASTYEKATLVTRIQEIVATVKIMQQVEATSNGMTRVRPTSERE